MSSLPTPAADRREDLSRVSPEIVLVDPELGRRLRRRLPVPRPRIRPPLPVLRLVSEDPRPPVEP